MKKHSMVAGVIMLFMGAVAFQSMRADAVTSAGLPTAQQISPYELMLNARDLPVESIDNLV